MENAIKKKVRKPQKGIECSVEGCTNWCVSNDLCNMHNMANRRYGSVHGKPVIEKICPICEKMFHTKRDDAIFCNSKCYWKFYKKNGLSVGKMEIRKE